MKVFVATLFLAASASTMAMPAQEDGVELLARVKRDACQAAAQPYANCVQQALLDSEKRLQAGGDGRADFFPRSGCNFLDAMLNCGESYWTACNIPKEEFRKLMKTGLEPAMDAFAQVPGWDGDKCPAFRYMMYDTREACDAATLSYATCVQQAKLDGEKQLQAGGDGSADYIPRTVCNSFANMLNCGEPYRRACNISKEEFRKLMKTDLEPTMDAFAQVPGWDGEKCPAFRHMKYYEP